MKICFELTDRENERLSEYIHERWGARSHGKKSEVVRTALIEYLSAHEKPTATPTREKKSEKRKPPVSREGEKKRPRIADSPELIATIDQMLQEGKTIQEIADSTGYAWSTVKNYLKNRS